MKSTKLRESEYLIAWAIFFLCATVGGGVVGFIVGALVGGILGAAGVSLKTIPIITGLIGFVLSIPISYFCFRFAVAKFVVEKIAGRSEPPPAVVLES
jgi:multisubunit Na+/H+ antiporter MnhE subunit